VSADNPCYGAFLRRIARVGEVLGRRAPSAFREAITATGRKRWSTAYVAAILVLGTCCASADAKTVVAKAGQVEATLRYHTTNNGTQVDDLKIVRAGHLLFDGVPSPRACSNPRLAHGEDCFPTEGKSTPPLRVVDLDGDGEPEVVYSAFTGGAHCCSVAQVYRLAPDQASYDAVDRSFGDGGFLLRDIERDGRIEFASDDDRFAYVFTAYVASGRPLQILRFRNGGFSDVTSSYPALIRRDAKFWWRGYRATRFGHDGFQQGQVAAWAADEYRLGKRSSVIRLLRKENRRGALASSARKGARFIARLDKFLRRLGYAK
jgi:hypothetical protein